MKELKPCPFCGSRNIQVIPAEVIAERQYYQVYCCSCGSRTVPYIVKEGAVNMWNKRHTWNNGRPTDDGKYLVLWKNTDTGWKEYSVLIWQSMINSWYDLDMASFWHDEYHAEVIAWQKIETYEASKDGE